MPDSTLENDEQQGEEEGSKPDQADSSGSAPDAGDPSGEDAGAETGSVDDGSEEEEPNVLGVVDEHALGDSDQGRAVNEALRAMSRAARSFLIYDTNNESILRFLKDYRECMEAALLFGPVNLEIRPFELVMEDEVVYLERDRDRSLAFRMFRDGVRRLELEPNVPWPELLKLLEILSIRYTGVRQNEDDIVTLLWKAGFQEIEVVAVEGFVPEEEAEGEYKSAEARQIRRASGTIEVPPDWDLPVEPHDEPAEIYYEVVPSVVLQSIREELSSQDLPFHCIHLTTQMVDLVLDPTDPTELDDVIYLIEEVRTFLLSEGQLDGLLALAQSLVGLRALDANRGDRELSRFADARALQRIIHSASVSSHEVPEELVSLLDLVPGDHLSNLIDVLRQERAPASRRISRQLIGRYVGAREATIEEAIRNEEGAVAADLLEAVAEADPGIAVKLVPELLFSEALEVQREVVNILEKVEAGHFSASILVGMLKTPGEQVRMRLLDMITETGDSWAFDPLMKRILDPGAINRMSDEEAEAIGKCMAILDPEKSLDIMGDWVRPKKWMDRLKGVTRGHLIQWAGVAGLGVIPDDEAAECIRWLSSRAGEKLHKHCVRAMVGRRHLGDRSAAASAGTDA
jgi:hypothetical protein